MLVSSAMKVRFNRERVSLLQIVFHNPAFSNAGCITQAEHAPTEVSEQ